MYTFPNKLELEGFLEKLEGNLGLEFNTVWNTNLFDFILMRFF